jgi:hypothetical protein
MKSKNFKELWHNMKSASFTTSRANLLKDLIDLTIKMFIIKPLMNLISGGGRHGGSRPAPNMRRRRRLGRRAWPRTGQAAARQQGLHRRRQPPHGAANDSGPMIGSLTINNDFRGADPPASVARSRRAWTSCEREFPGMIVGNDGRRRRERASCGGR